MKTILILVSADFIGTSTTYFLMSETSWSAASSAMPNHKLKGHD